ncbi:MAG: FAD-dependent oxidoreductase, partial [Proteobacteria bacterium]|nr:FAD-dependent oxidoreductase [Pseudomonadota bacterium]
MSSQAQEHCATVQDIAHVGRRYVIIRARADHQFSHAPGQFTKITFTDSAGSFSRFYSLASAPRGDASFELCLILDDIRLRQIVETWDIGSEFSCSSPAGRFFVPATDVPVVAIAGGSGITPLKSIIESRVLGILPSAPSTLLYGCKRDDEIPFYD